MNELVKSHKSIHSNTQPLSRVFYTDIQERDQNATNLNTYVANLNSKLDYAKWKQDLVLKFNYMPMKRIAERIEQEKQIYLNKIKEEEKQCAQILSGEQLTVQLELFRQFSKKLNQKILEFEIKIEAEKVQQQILNKEVMEKRDRLKQIMKENMDIIKSRLIEGGVHTKSELITLIRSRSTKKRLNLAYTSRRQNTQTERKETQAKLSIQQHKKQQLSLNKLYSQCLQKLVASIQAMNSSQDIQEGIYLDIMDRSIKKKFSEGTKHSTKSKICDILISKYGSKNSQSSKAKIDFQMDWKTFKQLNWKQIMGIIMVKDRNCQKMKKILRFK